jgi:hypothetical protein
LKASLFPFPSHRVHDAQQFLLDVRGDVCDFVVFCEIAEHIRIEELDVHFAGKVFANNDLAGQE